MSRLGAAILLLVWGCSTPGLEGKPCSETGDCLQGYRCSSGGRCVLLSDEVCDGEDNDGDGFVDQDLYSVAGAPQALPPATGELSQAPIFAWNGTRHLMAWAAGESVSGIVSVLYMMFDEDWRALGPVQTAATTTPETLLFSMRATAAPQGFVLVFGTALPPDISIRSVRLHDTGDADPPETFSAEGLVPDPRGLGPALDVAWGPNGLVAVVGHYSGNVPPTFNVSQDPPGVYLLRAGVPAQRVSGAPQTEPTRVRILSDGVGVVMGWNECTAGSSVDGPCARGSAFLRWPELEKTVPIGSSDRFDFAWHRGEILLATVGEGTEGDRIVLSRFDGRGAALGTPGELASNLSSVSIPAVTSSVTELGVVWHHALSNQTRFVIRRVNAEAEPIGDPVEILRRTGAADALLTSFHDGHGYGFVFSAEEFGVGPGLIEVRCTGPRDTADGGTDPGGSDGGAPKDGGVADAGVPDGGPGDGGPEILPPALRCPTSTDGGPVVAGSVRTVAGTAFDGLPVIVGSCWVPTDAQGRFEAAVTPPYDLSVVYDSSEGFVIVFSFGSVETLAPALRLPLRRRLGGVQVAGNYDPAPSRVGSLHVLAEGASATASLEPGVQNLTFQVAGAGNGSALLLEQDPIGDFVGVQVWTGLTFGTSSIDLGAFAPSSVASRLLAGTVPVAEMVTLELHLREMGESVIAHEVMLPSSTYAMALPDLGGSLSLEQYLVAHLEFSDGSSGWSASPAVTVAMTEHRFDLPEVPAQISPAFRATGVGLAPRFELSSSAGASAYGVQLIQLLGEQSGLFCVVVGDSPVLVLPDLSPFGYGLPPGEAVTWSGFALRGATAAGMLEGQTFTGGNLSRALPGVSARITGPSQFTP